VAQSFQLPPEPLVDRNLFRRAAAAVAPVPPFADVLPRLPSPVLPEDPALESLYWAAWEALWSRLRSPSPGSRLVAPYPYPADETQPAADQLETDALVFVAQLAGYLPGAFRLIDILDNVYARQHDNGFISRAFEPHSGNDYHQPYEPNSAGPNLLAWAEWRYFRLTGDAERISAVFWPLLAHHRWLRANRTWPSGLYWSTGHSSGLVNQPRVPGARHHHKHWSWVDATAQASLSAALLERMAGLLSERELGEEVSAERAQLAQSFNTVMWNNDAHFYQDVAPDGRFSPVKSIAAYWALMDSQLVPKERLTPFVQHLRDSWSFRTPTVVPSMSADSEAYNARSGNGWRGGVWPALTYMVLRGLEVAQQAPLAHQLAVSHVAAVQQVYEASHCFWQTYAPEEAEPGEPAAEDLSGRTPAAIIAMTLEYVLGLTVDWPLRQVTWRRRLDRAATHGVRNLPLGDEGTLDLLSSGKTVHIRADAPFTLLLPDGQDVVQTAVPAGAFTIDLS